MINGAFNEQERYVATYSKSHKIQKIIVPNIHSYFLSYISTLPSLSKKMFQMVQIELNKKDGYLLEGHRFLQCNGEQIAPVSINDIPHSSIIEESCLSTKTKLYISQYKPTNIVQLLDPEYGNSDINRDVKYYFIK